MNFEKTTAATSLTTAIIALFVAVWQTHESRVHNRQAVTPIINVSASSVGEETGVYIANKGTGPAILSSVTLYAKSGGEIKSHTNWLSLSSDLPYVGPIQSKDLPAGFTIAVGEKIKVFSPGKDATNDETANFGSALEHFFDIELRYKSIYEDEYRAVLGALLGSNADA